MFTTLQNITKRLTNNNFFQLCTVRYASKKTGTGCRNPKSHGRPKHRGWKRQDGAWVEAGTILVTQRTLRFHPGLNAGLGRNGTIYALKPGTVMVTCEKADLNWDHHWVQRYYGGRMFQTIYKKYFNVVTKPQHQNFKLVDQI